MPKGNFKLILPQECKIKNENSAVFTESDMVFPTENHRQKISVKKCQKSFILKAFFCLNFTKNIYEISHYILHLTAFCGIIFL